MTTKLIRLYILKKRSVYYRIVGDFRHPKPTRLLHDLSMNSPDRPEFDLSKDAEEFGIKYNWEQSTTSRQSIRRSLLLVGVTGKHRLQMSDETLTTIATSQEIANQIGNPPKYSVQSLQAIPEKIYGIAIEIRESIPYGRVEVAGTPIAFVNVCDSKPD